jgi:methyl-accepting chemotaxis protein
MLANLRISYRLAVAVAVPVMVLIGLAGYDLSVKANAWNDTARLGSLAEGVAKISRLIHELQRERGNSAVFIGSKGAQMREELPQQRKRSDSEREPALAIMKVLGTMATGDFKAAIGQAETAIASLDARRQEIDGLKIAARNSFDYYTETITKLLAVTSEIAKVAGHGDISMAVSAYVSFVQGKERAGQERALSAGGITAGKFESSGYSRVLGLVQAQEVFFVNFLGLATEAQRQFYAGTLSGPVVDTVVSMREAIASGGLSGEMKGLTGKTWFDAATARIDTMKTVEDRLAVDLAALTSSRRSETGWALVVLSALMVGALAFSLSVVLIMARSITRPLDTLKGAMEALAGGNTSVEVETGRRDEIGEMAKAVLVFRDAAIDKVRMEREAEEERVRSEAARKQAEEEAIGRERAMVSSSIGAGMAKLAAKDLTFRLTDDLPEAYAKLQADFNAALEQLEQALQGVASSTEAMNSGTQEISTASNDLSRRTEQQASSLEETAAALDEITATVKKAAEGATHARKVVAGTKEDAERSGEVVRKAVEAMGGIEKSSQQISQIIGVIDEIAFQTNLLALNAGVEAARAGDAGRGFAVVASEVRALAQRSAEAAKEIKSLISTSTAQVGEGVQLVAETGQSLDRIMAKVAEINTVVSDIAAGAQEQATGLQQVNTAVNEMDKVTQQNAAMAEEATAAGRSLAQEAEQLTSLVGQFQLGNVASFQPARRVHKAEPVRTPASKAEQAPKRQLKVPAGRNGSAVRKPEAQPAEEGWQDF